MNISDRDEFGPVTVVYSAIQSLVQYQRNARTHSKRQLQQIASSIKEFGFTNPVLIDRDNTIIAGHGRVLAAEILGLNVVPTIRLDHLSKDQIRAYVIADNKLAENAGWDKSILAIELQHLIVSPEIVDITLTGFEVPEIDLIIESVGDDDTEQQEEIEVPAYPVTNVGDLWLLGKHRILCDNALTEKSFQSLFETSRAALAFSDPPYNVKIDGHVSGNGQIHHREFAMATGEMTQQEFIQFLSQSLGLMSRYSCAGAVHYICMDWCHQFELLQAGRAVYDDLLNICVWAKNNGGLGSFYRSQHELISVYRNHGGAHRNNIQLGKYGRNRTNVWEYPCASTFSRRGEEGNLLALHPTVKPVPMVADAILDCSMRGDIVLDPFLGSGTTLIAAERVGRLCYGMELDPLYIDVALQRWQKLTGETPIHASSGKSYAEVALDREVVNV